MMDFRFSVLLVMPMLSLCLSAQDSLIEVNPNRPTFATPALTTQVGAAELEFGLQNVFQRDSATAVATPTLLKLGILNDFEIRISTNGYLRLGASGEPTETGKGDLTFGAQWCFLHSGPLGLDMAIQATHKFPTANQDKGLGSGESDDMVMLLFSRDIGPNHLDVNVLQTWLGHPRDDGGGTVNQPAGTVSLSHGINDTWSVGGEIYGIGRTALNPRILSNLWYVAYKVSKSLVLDCGMDIGLNHDAQKYTIFAGFTMGLGRFRRMSGTRT